MSSIPPTTPPGGGAPPPFPPYDPRIQWRVYREQQRAAWRAQRDAWKAQHYAAKAGYLGAYGPRVPSVVGPIILIGVGVIALLVLIGRINAGDFWAWYGRWWPLLLIGAGLALLGEWALDLRRKTPVRRGGGFAGILIVLAIVGVGAAKWKSGGQWFEEYGGREFGQNGEFLNAFRLPEHDNDQPALSARILSNASIQIENPRGDVSVTAGDGSTIEVQAHEVAFAGSDAEARNIFDAEAAHLAVSGGAVLVKSEMNQEGHVNLTVTVPRSAKVTVNSGRGDVTAAGLGAGINISAAHGDVQLSAITGSVQVHFSGSKHDFSAHQINGDLSIDGDSNDLNLSEIKGKIAQNGEILGDAHIENVSGPIHLHTSVTDLELAALPGDLTLDSDDLRIVEAKGPVHVTSHSKDIDLSQIYGDSYVEDRDGSISVEPAGAYGVEAKNGKGNVEVTLPPDASATVDGRARNGDIVSDFGLTISGDENKSVTGRIGSGVSKIILSADNGDLRIKKGPAFPAAPPAPSAAASKAPAAHGAIHLRTPKALPPKPVTQ
jgi:DUF4097 and DUF4098 domain-containing protein YvlB